MTSRLCQPPTHGGGRVPAVAERSDGCLAPLVVPPLGGPAKAGITNSACPPTFALTNKWGNDSRGSHTHVARPAKYAGRFAGIAKWRCLRQLFAQPQAERQVISKILETLPPPALSPATHEVQRLVWLALVIPAREYPVCESRAGSSFCPAFSRKRKSSPAAAAA